MDQDADDGDEDHERGDLIETHLRGEAFVTFTPRFLERRGRHMLALRPCLPQM